MGRNMRTVLVVLPLKPSQPPAPSQTYQKAVQRNYKASKMREFTVGKEVYMRLYNPHGDPWVAGIVTKKHG